MSSSQLIESLRSIINGEKEVTPKDYTRLMYNICRQNKSEEDLDELRNMRCILNMKGNFIYPHEALMSNTDSLNDDRFIDNILNRNVYHTLYNDQRFKLFLESLGVGEIVSTELDDITYNILIDNQDKSVCIVDEELKEINHIDISAHWPRHEPYSTTGEISLVFLPLNDDFNHRESELVTAELSLGYNNKWIAVVNKNTEQIIVPFTRGNAELDIENNRIIFCKAIYSIDGERLFPNDSYPNDDLTIIYPRQSVKRSKAGICIASDTLGHNYFIIKKDCSVSPLDSKIYSYNPTYCRGDMEFEIWENGMIKAVETFKDSWGYSIVPELTHKTLLDSEGNFILSSDMIIYDRINNHIITECKYGKGIRKIHDMDLNYLYSMHNHRSLMSDEFYNPFRRIETEYNGCRYFGIVETSESDDMRWLTEKLIFPPICEEVVLLYKDGPFKIKLNGKYGLLQQSGNMTTPICFDYIGEFANGVAEARVGDINMQINIFGERV